MPVKPSTEPRGDTGADAECHDTIDAPAGDPAEAAEPEVDAEPARERAPAPRPMVDLGPAPRPVAPTAEAYVLVVEDEEALATLLQYNLEREGFKVVIARDGEEALMLVGERQPDLILLDWMLPKVTGIEVCRRLRLRPECRNVPIIMLTARGEESDRVRGLDGGADDYVVKPFAMSELFARLRAVLRRIRPGLSEERLRCGDLVIDRSARKVKARGAEVRLGPTEFRLLDYLMQHPGRVFSREQLLDAVWGSDVYVEARTVDVHIGRLRKALKKDAGADPIRTVRSAGYALDPELVL